MVPNPGIVSALKFEKGRFIFSRVLQITIKARVESKPPDTPRVIGVLPMFSSRFANPATWIWKISSQRSFSSIELAGTKGCGIISLSNLEDGTDRSIIPALSSWNPILRKLLLLSWELSAQVPVLLRLFMTRCRSTSAIRWLSSRLNRVFSAISWPFSAIMQCPPKTKSVLDS